MLDVVIVVVAVLFLMTSLLMLMWMLTELTVLLMLLGAAGAVVMLLYLLLRHPWQHTCSLIGIGFAAVDGILLAVIIAGAVVECCCGCGGLFYHERCCRWGLSTCVAIIGAVVAWSLSVIQI